MTRFETSHLPVDPNVLAPDGSAVRFLLTLKGGSMAHFELAAGQTASAVTHRTVEEIWFVLGGRGEMWRRQDDREETIVLEAGTCLSIPCGTHFQFRASPTEAVAAVAITMPPWPGADEAVPVNGPWQASHP